jgi:alpha-glucosidase
VQPADWDRMTVEAQQGDPDSMLELYRSALRVRRSVESLRTDRDQLRWIPSGPEVLAYRRGEAFACVLNFGAKDADLPEHAEILLRSGPLTEDGRLPADTAVWLRLV